MPWKATERLYLDRTKTQVLREGEFSGGAFLLCGVGATVSDRVCRQYGIGPYADIAPAAPETVTEPLAEPEPTETPPDEPEAPENEPQSDPEEDLTPRRRR